METSYPLDDNFTSNGINITEEIRSYLYEIAKWGKFLSIVGFCFIGLMMIGLLLMIAGLGTMSHLTEMGALGGLGMSFFIIIYALLIALYFFPSLYLYRFSSKMKTALDANDQVFLSESFMNLKSLLKFVGILTAILIGLYVLGFFGSIMLM